MSIKTARLQVLFRMQEYQALQVFAKQQGLGLGEWVRQVLQRTIQEKSSMKSEQKMAAVRAAVALSEPVGDIDQMLAEIEQGYDAI